MGCCLLTELEVVEVDEVVVPSAAVTVTELVRDVMDWWLVTAAAAVLVPSVVE